MLWTTPLRKTEWYWGPIALLVCRWREHNCCARDTYVYALRLGSWTAYRTNYNCQVSWGQGHFLINGLDKSWVSYMVWGSFPPGSVTCPVCTCIYMPEIGGESCPNCKAHRNEAQWILAYLDKQHDLVSRQITEESENNE